MGAAKGGCEVWFVTFAEPLAEPIRTLATLAATARPEVMTPRATLVCLSFLSTPQCRNTVEVQDEEDIVVVFYTWI